MVASVSIAAEDRRPGFWSLDRVFEDQQALAMELTGDRGRARVHFAIEAGVRGQKRLLQLKDSPKKGGKHLSYNPWTREAVPSCLSGEALQLSWPIPGMDSLEKPHF